MRLTSGLDVAVCSSLGAEAALTSSPMLGCSSRVGKIDSLWSSTFALVDRQPMAPAWQPACHLEVSGMLHLS